MLRQFLQLFDVGVNVLKVNIVPFDLNWKYKAANVVKRSRGVLGAKNCFFALRQITELKEQQDRQAQSVQPTTTQTQNEGSQVVLPNGKIQYTDAHQQVGLQLQWVAARFDAEELVSLFERNFAFNDAASLQKDSYA